MFTPTELEVMAAFAAIDTHEWEWVLRSEGAHVGGWIVRKDGTDEPVKLVGTIIAVMRDALRVATEHSK